MVIQYRQFGPTPHPRRVRLTQAQLEVGRTVCHQADYKTGVVSTTIPRGPRCLKFLERSEPAQVLHMRRRAGIAVLQAPRQPFLLIQFGGYVPQNSECKFFLSTYGGCSHIHVLYDSTSCHEFGQSLNTEATAMFMFYMNRLLAMSFDGR
jgi:hypothetical protein